MKQIAMNELIVGDIFTYEMNLSSRVVFKVIEIAKRLTCINRTTKETVKKSIEGYVILLRHED